jgi:hypothetical protein
MSALALMSASTITPAAIEVALPTDVTSPVMLAFVVTVAALPEIFVWSPVFVPLTAVAPVTVREGVPDPVIVTVLYLPAVMSPVVSAIVAAES